MNEAPTPRPSSQRSRMRLGLAGAVALAIATSMHAAHAYPVSTFDIDIPPGWIRYSPSTAAQFDKLPPAMLASVKSPSAALVALAPGPSGDLTPSPDAPAFASVNVVLERQPSNIVTQSFIDQVAEVTAKGTAAQLHLDVHVAQASVVQLQGVACGRITLDLSGENASLREVQYYLPGEKELAIVTYSFPSATLASLFPQAEAAMSTTRGMVTPASHGGLFDPMRSMRSALIGGAVGLVIGGIVALVKMARKRAS